MRCDMLFCNRTYRHIACKSTLHLFPSLLPCKTFTRESSTLLVTGTLFPSLASSAFPRYFQC